MKKLLLHPLAILSAAGIVLWGVSWVTDFVNDHLAQLVVLPVDPHPGDLGPGQTSPNLRKLYLLLAHNAPAPTSANGSDVIDLNAAFVSQAAVETPPPPDYFKALTENRLVKLDATTDGGAIINGRFIAYGEPIEAFPYPIGNSSKTPAPRLRKAQAAGTVLVQEPNGRRSFTLPQ